METSLGDHKTSCGSATWAADRVHLSPKGYRDVAAAVLEVAQGGMDREDGDDDTSSEVWATRRRHLELVITFPAARGRGSVPARGGGRSRVPPTAGWLLGMPGRGGSTGVDRRSGDGGGRGFRGGHSRGSHCSHGRGFAWRGGCSRGGRDQKTNKTVCLMILFSPAGGRYICTHSQMGFYISYWVFTTQLTALLFISPHNTT